MGYRENRRPSHHYLLLSFNPVLVSVPTSAKCKNLKDAAHTHWRRQPRGALQFQTLTAAQQNETAAWSEFQTAVVHSAENVRATMISKISHKERQAEIPIKPPQQKTLTASCVVAVSAFVSCVCVSVCLSSAIVRMKHDGLRSTVVPRNLQSSVGGNKNAWLWSARSTTR